MADQPDKDYVDSYEDVSMFVLSDEREELLLNTQTECTFMWTTKDHEPVGVIMNFVWKDGRFWITCTRRRKRVAAVEARPKVAIAISSRGTKLASSQAVTYKGDAIVRDDRETKDWFYPRLAERQRQGDAEIAEFLRRIDTPGRVVIELDPVSWITYDGNRLEASLRGMEYDPAMAKPTRNPARPPDGWITRWWTDAGLGD